MADEVVVGATRRDLVVILVDAVSGVPINLTGGSAKLQGKSPDLPAVPFDAAMTLTDAANGKVTLAGLGSLVTHANLAAVSMKSATYALRVRFVDASSKVDFGTEFEVVYKDNPLGA